MRAPDVDCRGVIAHLSSLGALAQLHKVLYADSATPAARQTSDHSLNRGGTKGPGRSTSGAIAPYSAATSSAFRVDDIRTGEIVEVQLVLTVRTATIAAAA